MFNNNCHYLINTFELHFQIDIFSFFFCSTQQKPRYSRLTQCFYGYYIIFQEIAITIYLFLDGRLLKSLTLNEVQNLFRRLKLTTYVDAVSRNKINGEYLYKCNSIESLAPLGIEAETNELILFEKIKNFKDQGVPLELIIPTTGQQVLSINNMYDNATMIDCI